VVVDAPVPRVGSSGRHVFIAACTLGSLRSNVVGVVDVAPAAVVGVVPPATVVEVVGNFTPWSSKQLTYALNAELF
jgi:hypothetical protein